MKKNKRELQEINAGSMADIAFLLLIFFLITTTMASEQGILNLLPPKQDEVPEIIIKERNLLKILVNKDDYLLVEGKYMKIEELAEFTEKFLLNNGADPDLSDNPQKAVVSLKNDRGTSYSRYIDVQNELRKAYNKVRNDLALAQYGKTYNDCSDAQQKVLKDKIPQKISEAEQANVGGDI